MVIATAAFLAWWIPVSYLGLRGGIEMHPEFDITVRRFALTAAVFALASVILAWRNPDRSVWIGTTRVVGWSSVVGLLTTVFAVQ